MKSIPAADGSIRSAFATALAAVLLIQCAWLAALPMFRGPDEIDHLLRSSTVALGHWQPVERLEYADPRVVTAQGELARAAGPVCLELRKDLDPEVCSPLRSLADGTVEIRSVSAPYNPAYYFVTGLPLRVLDGEAGAWAVRVVGAVLSAMLIAWAWAMVASRRRTGWPSMAFLLALTPAVAFATTVAAPNGMGFAAGLLMWAGLLSACRNRRSAHAPAASALGAGVVVLTHPTGIIWVGAAVLTVLLLVGWRGVREILLSRPRAWIAGIVCVAVFMAFTVAWTLIYAPNAPTANEPLVAETKEIPMVGHVILWIFQTLGVMPNRFGLLWPIAYAMWLAPLVLLLAGGIRGGNRRERLAGSVAMTIAVLIPTVATVMTYDAVGVAWQGRYELPLLVGLAMLAGEILDRGTDVPGPLAWAVVAVVAVTSYLCLLCLGLREARGPYDDGRPWQLLLVATAPTLLAVGYVLLARASRVGSVQAE